MVFIGPENEMEKFSENETTQAMCGQHDSRLRIKKSGGWLTIGER